MSLCGKRCAQGVFTQRAGEGLCSQPFHDAGGREGAWARHLLKGEVVGLSVHRCFYRAGGPSGAGGSPKVGTPQVQACSGMLLGLGRRGLVPDVGWPGALGPQGAARRSRVSQGAPRPVPGPAVLGCSRLSRYSQGWCLFWGLLMWIPDPAFLGALWFPGVRSCQGSLRCQCSKQAPIPGALSVLGVPGSPGIPWGRFLAEMPRSLTAFAPCSASLSNPGVPPAQGALGVSAWSWHLFLVLCQCW